MFLLWVILSLVVFALLVSIPVYIVEREYMMIIATIVAIVAFVVFAVICFINELQPF